MTKWAEFPLRPQGQPWPGLNTRGGRLDPGQGQLEDGSFNGVVNEADILEKRKGIIRGIDERFEGVVCGLFKYTSECGIEYLIVADEESIKVRTPFNVPVFLGTDSLPNDDFNGEAVSDRWTNSELYDIFIGSLIVDPLAPFVDAPSVPADRLMQWFKASVLTSYQVEIQYALVAAGASQAASVVIKRTVTSYLVASVSIFAGSYSVLVEVVQSGVATTLATSPLEGSSLTAGFLRLAYDAETRTVTCRVVPTGGSIVTLDATLSEAQDANLGQNSAIGMVMASNDAPEILQVTGGAIGS